MKKLLLLAVALVMSVCSWAQVDLASGVYEIENVSDEGGAGIGRGYLIDFTDYANGPSIGDCPWSNYRNNHPTERNNGTTTCSYWYLYNADGKCYLFSLSTLGGNTAPKFLVVGSQGSKNNTWSQAKNAIEIVNNPNKEGSVGIRNAGVTANNEYASMACGTQSTKGAVLVDALTDGGAKLSFKTVEASQLSEAQTTLMNAGIAICQAKDPEPYKFVSELQDGKTYVIINKQQQGYPNYLLHTVNGAVTPQNANGMNIETKWAEADQYVAHVQENGNYVFENVVSGAYLAWKGKSGGVNNNSGFDTVIADHTSWEVNKGTRFENTFYLSVTKRATNNNSAGVLIIKNDGTWDAWTSGENLTNAAYSNNFGFVLVEGTEPGPKPEEATLTASLLNGSNEVALSAEEATSVATATGIKFTYENASSYIGYYYTIAKAGEEDPIYGSEMAIGEGTGTDTFDAAINFAKGETYQVTVSFFPEGPEFTFDLTGTYEEEEGPTGETVATYTLSTPRGDLFTDGNGLLLTTRSLTLAGSRTETNDKWVIIEAKDSEHGVYIYNVEHNTFIGNNNRGTNGVTAPMVAEPNMFYRWATGSTNETVKNNAYNDLQYKETDYPWSLGEEDGLVGGKYYTINVCNWDDNQGNHTGLRLCSTSGYDDGNIFAITASGTITKEAYDAIYAKIYGAATEAEVTAAEQLLALTGVGYPTATAEARVALATLLEQEEIGKTELAEAVAAFQASTEIEMPKVGKYYVDAQFVDGSSARMTAKNDVLTFTKVESELEAAYVNVVSVEGNTVVMTIGDKYVHVTCGADAASKEADVDGLTETQGDNTNLTLEVGGAAQFGRFLIQGLTSSNARYYLTTRDDLDGTFAFVANTPNEKFYDTNYNGNGHFRTSYYTFTAVEEEGPTGEEEFAVVDNTNNTLTVTPADVNTPWYVAYMPTSELEGLDEEEAYGALAMFFMESVADITSEEDYHVGQQTVTATGLAEGTYKVVVGHVKYDEDWMSYVPAGTVEIYDLTVQGTTGIANVASAMSSNAIFNLQGQRIVKLQKGINIVGGQKVIK